VSGDEASKNYLEADVSTANPLRLVILVCDFGLDQLKRAVVLLENDSGNNRCEFLDTTFKARQALLELMGSLRPDKSPEIAGNLLNLYGYFFRQLTDARIKTDAVPLKEIIKLWGELRDGWHQVLQNGSTGISEKDGQNTVQLVSVTG